MEEQVWEAGVCQVCNASEAEQREGGAGGRGDKLCKASESGVHRAPVHTHRWGNSEYIAVMDSWKERRAHQDCR